MRDLGKTIVLTTHSMEEADSLANRVAVLAAGRIVAACPPRSVTRRDCRMSRITFTRRIGS
jgi:ABC-2 type transport system ATP-binding protein